jgi:hypothetical protein
MKNGNIVQRFYYDYRNSLIKVENYKSSGVVTSTADYIAG